MPVQKVKLSIVTVKPDVDFFVDVNALLSYHHACATPSVPPFSDLSFFKMISETLFIHQQREVSAKWFTMNWCIKVLFSLGSSMLTVSNTHCFFSVLPFSCQSSAIVKNFLPCLLCSKPLQTKYTVCIHVRPYTQLRFSLCTGCCLKCRISTKMFVFVQETRSFVVLCIMVALPVDKICSRYQLSPQTLSTVCYGASNSAV